MSNPGVIVLAQAHSREDAIRRFQIEDNIGEAIHVHIDNTRLDLSIAEFRTLANMVRSSLDQLTLFGSYSAEFFDPMFLFRCARYLPQLESIQIENLPLHRLRFVVYSNFAGNRSIVRSVDVTRTPAFRFLAGKDCEFLAYPQDHYYGQTNEERLSSLRSSIENAGYPGGHAPIIAFNDQGYVRDGQHRAAILAFLYGTDHEVQIMRWRFSSRCMNIHPVKNNIYAVACTGLRLMRAIVARGRRTLSDVRPTE